MENIFSFYALVFRQKYIKRWGLMRNTNEENLSEHSAETAVIAHALAVIGNKFYGKNYNTDRVSVIALYHDVPEVYTGDLPTPVKYFSADMRENYRIIENNAVKLLLSKLPDELKNDYENIFNDSEYSSLVKAADKLCAYIKCIEEVKGGNTEFNSAKDSLLKIMENMNIPELNYFMKNLLPAFYLSIDEI